jgi:hypothetical protein
MILSIGILITCPALASLNSFAQLSGEDLRVQTQSGEWDHCDRELNLWCQNEMAYYRQAGYAELSLATSSARLELLFEYSSHTLSDLQLNLRRDGFSLELVSIEELVFDVRTELQAAHTAKELNDVDKRLIQFLNSASQEKPRNMRWEQNNWRAMLYSDGEMITLTLVEKES